MHHTDRTATPPAQGAEHGPQGCTVHAYVSWFVSDGVGLGDTGAETVPDTEEETLVEVEGVEEEDAVPVDDSVSELDHDGLSVAL